MNKECNCHKDSNGTRSCPEHSINRMKLQGESVMEDNTIIGYVVRYGGGPDQVFATPAFAEMRKEERESAGFNAEVIEVIGSYQLATITEENEKLRDLAKELIDGADRVSGEPYYIVQPFLGIFKRHSDTILALTPPEPSNVSQ